ncbi:MAG: hypothetical protein LBS10_10830 [Gracilibacteraceae bacterium]|jgi:RNA polymerase subunit RPABC4/transcription elongation factor Spt4|nr:hypothetical protein [Gracilibacteraceae bacterium]
MAAKLKKCGSCGAEIASSAKTCPQCGAKNKQPIFKKWWFWVIVVVVIVIGIASSMGGGNSPSTTTPSTDQSGGTTPAQEVPKPDPIVLDTDTLFDALEANALKASSTYKGQYVELTGKLSSIDSSGSYFSLGSLVDEWSFDTVLCNITKNQQAIVAEFEKDQEVTVVGTITDVGEIMGYTIKVESIK